MLPIVSGTETPIIFLISTLYFKFTGFPTLVFIYFVSIRSTHGPRETRVSRVGRWTVSVVDVY